MLNVSVAVEVRAETATAERTLGANFCGFSRIFMVRSMVSPARPAHSFLSTAQVDRQDKDLVGGVHPVPP